MYTSNKYLWSVKLVLCRAQVVPAKAKLDRQTAKLSPCGTLLCWHYKNELHYVKVLMASSWVLPDWLPYIRNFSRQEILVKMMFGRCVKFTLSPIFANSRILNEDVNQGLFFAVSSFLDFREVANSAKIKPSWKIPDIQYFTVFALCTDNFRKSSKSTTPTRTYLRER